MAITCPRCGSEFDATLFQFGHRVRCGCGMEIEYPGIDQRGGHVLAQGAHVSAKYAEFYEPWRGYGGTALRVLRLLADGGDHRGTGRLQFPEGSFGNGGAMRIAPVGLAYRNAAAEVLADAVEDALLCTHVHPEAIDGALVQAKAVAIAAATDPKALGPLVRQHRERRSSGAMRSWPWPVGWQVWRFGKA